MTDETETLPAIVVDGRAVAFFAEYQRHEPYHESCIRSATLADLIALVAALAPEQRETLLNSKALFDSSEALRRDAVMRLEMCAEMHQAAESRAANGERELAWVSRSQQLLSQVALEAIRVIHCTTHGGDPRVFEPCEDCSLGGVGNLRDALKRALGDGYTALVWGLDMNIDGEAWHAAEMRAAGVPTQPDSVPTGGGKEGR